MNSKTKSILTLSVLIAATLAGAVVVRPAQAVHGGNPAILAIWYETGKSNAVVDSGINTGTSIVLEVNVTDAGDLRGFNVNVTYSPAVVKPNPALTTCLGSTCTDLDYSGTDCTAASGCIFDGVSVIELQKTIDNVAGKLYVSVSTLAGTVVGTGTLFRITFTVQSVAATMVNIMQATSKLLNPGQVPYDSIDGYFDNRGNNNQEYFYTLSRTPLTVTVNRPVSGTATSSTVTVTVTLTRGTAKSTSLRLLSIPKGVTPNFSPSTGTGGFTSMLTLTITGGPAGGATTTPSGTFKMAITGNVTVVPGQYVAVTWLQLVVAPPPAPNYTLSANQSSVTIHQGGWKLITVTGTLISGTAEPVSLDCNLNTFVVGGDCLFSDPSPTLPFTVTANITIGPSATPATYNFNITGTSIGIYSETSVVKRIQNYAITVVPFDFQVTSMSVSRHFAYFGVTSNPVTVTMTVKNNGASSGTFTVRARATNTTHSMLIGTQSVTLAAGASQVITYSWNPQLLKRGTYEVLGETQLASTYSGMGFFDAGSMLVKFKGDVNNDCTVNIIDLARVGASFGAVAGPPPSANWDPEADMNNDGQINIVDFANVGASFGQSCPP